MKKMKFFKLLNMLINIKLKNYNKYNKIIFNLTY